MSLVKVDFCNIYWVARHSSTQFVMSCNPIKLLKNIVVLHARRPTHVEVPHPVAVAEHELPEKKRKYLNINYYVWHERASIQVIECHVFLLRYIPCLRHDGGEDAEQQPSHGDDLKKWREDFDFTCNLFFKKTRIVFVGE